MLGARRGCLCCLLITKLFFVAVVVVYADERTAEGQYFTEGDEYGVVYLAQWWAEEACGEHYAAEAAQCHSDDKLQTFHLIKNFELRGDDLTTELHGTTLNQGYISCFRVCPCSSVVGSIPTEIHLSAVMI